MEKYCVMVCYAMLCYVVIWLFLDSWIIGNFSFMFLSYFQSVDIHRDVNIGDFPISISSLNIFEPSAVPISHLNGLTWKSK